MNDSSVFPILAHPDYIRTPEIQWLIEDPMGWLQFHQTQQKKKQSRFEGTQSYLVTFSYNPNSRYDKIKWLKRIEKEIHKRFITNCVYAIEHIDTNIHCHVAMDTNKPISIREFKVFARDYGYVDIRRIKTDNGVADYFVKEFPQGESVKRLSDWKQYSSEIENKILQINNV